MGEKHIAQRLEENTYRESKANVQVQALCPYSHNTILQPMSSITSPIGLLLNEMA